jgi:hypothetical protein
MTGVISGTPTTAGTYGIIIQAGNANGYGSYSTSQIAIGNSSESNLVGLSWASRWNTNVVMTEIEYGGGWYVGLSGTNVSRTQDGVNWSSVEVAAGVTMSELGYGNGVWLTVGSNSKVYRSIDNGASWALAGTMPGVGGSLLKAGSVWLARNGTTVYRSVDNGSTWSSVATGAAQGLADMAVGGGVIVAVGGGGEIVSSSDGGVSWMRRASGTTMAVQSIAYGNGRFLAVGTANVILTSVDGVTWKTVSAVTTSNSLAFGNGMFMRGYGDMSADGAVWTSSSSPGSGGDETKVYGASGWMSIFSSYQSKVDQSVGGGVPSASHQNAQGIVGQSFQSQISAAGATTYTALQLPPGLSLNAMTGVISGTPTTAGTYGIIIQAGNANGYGSYSTSQIAIGN